MATIQIVLDEELLLAADRAAERVRMNRSALFREALRDYLRTLRTRELERRDKEGYEHHPDGTDLARWESVAAWPEG